jgi:hypothetical protein
MPTGTSAHDKPPAIRPATQPDKTPGWGRNSVTGKQETTYLILWIQADLLRRSGQMRIEL